jgi:hypothetical protein
MAYILLESDELPVRDFVEDPRYLRRSWTSRSGKNVAVDQKCYEWSGHYVEIKCYFESCEICQRMSTRHHYILPSGLLLIASGMFIFNTCPGHP